MCTRGAVKETMLSGAPHSDGMLRSTHTLADEEVHYDVRGFRPGIDVYCADHSRLLEGSLRARSDRSTVWEERRENA